MRRTIVIAFLSLAVPVAAWAKGGVAPAAVAAAPATGKVSAVSSSGPTTGTTSSSASSFNGSSTSTPLVATSGANGTALPPPPPQSVTQSAAQQGVPASETPQPLATDTTGNGFSPQLNNQIRPSAAGNTATLTSVQASLAAGGLYTGPIDGSNSAALRASISEYQQLQNLPATGNLDAETLARIDRTPSTGSGSNGAASTAGTATSASGFSSSLGLLPAGTPSAGSGSPVITSQPFPLSVNVNMSPYPPAGTTMQP
jgi:hypothetical protein